MIRTKTFSHTDNAAFFVWADKRSGSFSSFTKHHLMLTLCWSANNDQIKQALLENNGDIQRSADRLLSDFRNDFAGNIAYLQEIYTAEVVAGMLRKVRVFIVETVDKFLSEHTASIYQHH